MVKRMSILQLTAQYTALAVRQSQPDLHFPDCKLARKNGKLHSYTLPVKFPLFDSTLGRNRFPGITGKFTTHNEQSVARTSPTSRAFRPVQDQWERSRCWECRLLLPSRF